MLKISKHVNDGHKSAKVALKISSNNRKLYLARCLKFGLSCTFLIDRLFENMKKAWCCDYIIWSRIESNFQESFETTIYSIKYEKKPFLGLTGGSKMARFSLSNFMGELKCWLFYCNLTTREHDPILGIGFTRDALKHQNAPTDISIVIILFNCHWRKPLNWKALDSCCSALALNWS